MWPIGTQKAPSDRHPFLAAALGERGQSIGRAYDADLAEGAEGEQIVVAGGDEIGAGGECTGEQASSSGSREVAAIGSGSTSVTGHPISEGPATLALDGSGVILRRKAPALRQQRLAIEAIGEIVDIRARDPARFEVIPPAIHHRDDLEHRLGGICVGQAEERALRHGIPQGRFASLRANGELLVSLT